MIYRSEAGMDYPALGVRVDSVRLHLTGLGAYVETTWSIVDRETFDRAARNTVVFAFVDEEGEALNSLGSDVTKLSETQYMQASTLMGIKADPGSVFLRGYGTMQEGISETHEIVIRPVK